MMAVDPARQRMLMRTEIEVRIADAPGGKLLQDEINTHIKELTSKGFDVQNIQELGTRVLILGRRISSPIADATPQGVPVPGTKGKQSVQVIYSRIKGGDLDELKCTSLREAVQQAAHDEQTGFQPLAIHVTSITEYGFADIMAMKDSR